MNWDQFENFKEAEFRCKCCGRAAMDGTFVGRLQQLRTATGIPLIISSGFRCPDHNDRVSSTGRNGPHTTGHAADISVSRGDAFKILRYAMSFGFTGIGVQQKGDGRYLHLDDLPASPGVLRPTIWSY